MDGIAALLANSEGSEGPSGSTSGRDGGPPAAKRTCLRHYDQVSKQVLNAMGASGVETAPLKKLYEVMASGNKGVKCFSNLCYEDPKRQRIGVSQTCEVLEAAIERLLTDDLKHVLKDNVYELAVAEAKELLPHVKTLNTGPLPDAQSASASSIAFYGSNKRSRPIPAPADSKAAAGKLYEFLINTKSMLRAVLQVLSSGGLWYNGATWDKAMRAWLQVKGVSKTDFQNLSVVVEAADGPVEERPTAMFASNGA